MSSFYVANAPGNDDLFWSNMLPVQVQNYAFYFGSQEFMQKPSANVDHVHGILKSYQLFWGELRLSYMIVPAHMVCRTLPLIPAAAEMNLFTFERFQTGKLTSPYTADIADISWHQEVSPEKVTRINKGSLHYVQHFLPSEDPNLLAANISLPHWVNTTSYGFISADIIAFCWRLLLLLLFRLVGREEKIPSSNDCNFRFDATSPLVFGLDP